jgi:cell division protein FtsL
MTLGGADMDATEYAISKDVRNSLIVREVDETRQRQLWRWMAVALVLVVIAVITAWQQMELIRSEKGIARMQQERAAEEATTRQLRLEIERLQSPKRIEQLAIGRLHMVFPARDSVIVLERVVLSDPPPSSIVASR